MAGRVDPADERAALYCEAKAEAIARKSGLDPDQVQFAVQQLRVIAGELRAGFHVEGVSDGEG